MLRAESGLQYKCLRGPVFVCAGCIIKIVAAPAERENSFHLCCTHYVIHGNCVHVLQVHQCCRLTEINLSGSEDV